MRKVKATHRSANVTRLLALVVVCVGCAGVAWISDAGGMSTASVAANPSCAAAHLPVLCAHRIVGDEVDKLSWLPVRAMDKLFKQGIYCFDADVVRLADDSLYVAHPLMFKPVVEHKMQRPLQPADGQSLTEAALLEAQKLTHEDVINAEPHLGNDDVRPVLLKAVLNTFSTSIAAHSDEIPESGQGVKPRAVPRLFLEPKRNTYQTDSLAELWSHVEELNLQEFVAVWAMDPSHYDILKSATGGKARTIWGYMDQQFSDQISTVAFPAPVPPRVKAESPLQMFGIAKHAPARRATGDLGPASETMIALWVMDTIEEFLEACKERADIVITNKPLQMQKAITASMASV